MPNVPPPGPALPFAEWSRVLVDRLRELLPDVRATRKGGMVTVRRPETARVVTISEDSGTYWIATADVGPSMPRLCDSDRHDAFTARTYAWTIAGGFGGRLSP